jgi:hypothetical protein
MARHNREGRGTDQRGYEYEVSYQPDWLRFVKVTRDLETGRQSTKTLFRNPLRSAEGEPGDRVRTRVTSPDQGIDFELSVADPKGAVIRVRVAYVLVGENGKKEEVEFSFEDRLPSPPRR